MLVNIFLAVWSIFIFQMFSSWWSFKRTLLKSFQKKQKSDTDRKIYGWGRRKSKRMLRLYREVKFKRALRLQFWLILQNLFCRFLTSKIWSDPDMINPSLESSDFLFWYEKLFASDFWKLVENRESAFHEFKFDVCLHTL